MKSYLYKIIYFPIINRLLRSILKILLKLKIVNFVIPPSGKIRIDCPENRGFFLWTNQTSYLSNVIYWNGLFAFEYSRIFYNLIKKMDVFIDIGSNIGLYSLLAFTSNPKINVLAFEPANGPFHYLEKNIIANNANSNIKVHKLALSNEIGSISFFEYKNPKYTYIKYNLGGTSSQIEKHNYKIEKKVHVPSVTLDKFIAAQSINSIDLIKIDTEGTENLILGAANYTLSKIRPIIICEVLFNKIEFDLENIMKSYNYVFYNFKGNQLVLADTIIRKKDNGIRDCFFVPIEKVSIIQKYCNPTWA